MYEVSSNFIVFVSNVQQQHPIYTVIENDLHPRSNKNIIVKFADDTTLVIPENSGVSLPEELNHISAWATVNRMSLALLKLRIGLLSFIVLAPRDSYVFICEEYQIC